MKNCFGSQNSVKFVVRLSQLPVDLFSSLRPHVGVMTQSFNSAFFPLFVDLRSGAVGTLEHIRLIPVTILMFVLSHQR